MILWPNIIKSLGYDTTVLWWTLFSDISLSSLLPYNVKCSLNYNIDFVILFSAEYNDCSFSTLPFWCHIKCWRDVIFDMNDFLGDTIVQYEKVHEDHNTYRQWTVTGLLPFCFCQVSTWSRSSSKAAFELGITLTSGQRWKWNCLTTRGTSWGCQFNKSIRHF